jgi:MFS family permease
VLGAVGGALLCGHLTDRLGRKKLFMVTLGVYLVFTTASEERSPATSARRVLIR